MAYRRCCTQSISHSHIHILIGEYAGECSCGPLPGGLPVVAPQDFSINPQATLRGNIEYNTLKEKSQHNGRLPVLGWNGQSPLIRQPGKGEALMAYCTRACRHTLKYCKKVFRKSFENILSL